MKNKKISVLSKLCKCYSREQMLQEDEEEEEDVADDSGSSLAVTSQVNARLDRVHSSGEMWYFIACSCYIVYSFSED